MYLASLAHHPAGNPSQFSFKMPKPLDENYVKKRTQPAKPTVDAEGMLLFSPPSLCIKCLGDFVEFL